MESNFTFWCPISKAVEKVVDPATGEDVMVLGGIASTADEDSDGEFLDPKGFDIKPLLESGLVNWHHQAKGSPATIIGEPRKAEIRKDGLYLETVLYPSSKIARDVWELAQTLEKDSKTRRLGYSIEGRVLERGSENPSDPGYKHINKAIITGVAITHMPKNPKTFANIIKGEIDDIEEEDFDKEIKQKTATPAPKRRALKKAQVFEMLFKDIPGININKSEKIYKLITKIADMNNKKTITDEDVLKAYDALGLSIESTDIEKGDGCGDGGSQKVLKKSEKDPEIESEDEKTSEETEEEEVEEEDSEGDAEEEEVEEEEKEVKKANTDELSRLERAIVSSHQMNFRGIRALGVLVKSISNDLQKAHEENENLKDIIKSQTDELASFRQALDDFGAQVPARKSVTAARVVERQFAKSNDSDIEKADVDAPKGVSISRQPNVIAEILDQATFAKGYDEEFSKACLTFEASKVLPSNIIARLKNEFGVNIIK